MYLEPGKCAQCGKAIAASAKYTPHNAKLNHVSPDLHEEMRPLFCSQECIEEITWPTWKSDAQKWLDDSQKDEFRTNLRREERLRDNLLQSNREDEHEALDSAANKISSAKYNDTWYDPDTLRKIRSEYQTKRDQLEREFNATKRRLEENLATRQRETVEGWQNAKPALEQTFLSTFFAEYVEARTKAQIQPPPPEITDQHRFEHTHILGPSGSGKTTLIQDLILQDSSQAMVVIDPKGFMVEQLARLKSIPEGRIIYIDPLVTPPLNLFKQGNRSVVTQAIANFDYIFAQSGSALTSKMRPVFKFCARLMFNIPGADIFLLMDFLESQQGDPRFAPYIASLDDLGAKRFFEKDFYSPKLYGETRQQIKGRFNDILSMPEVLSMFTAPQSLDFIQALNEKKIILVNTRAAEIGTDASQLVGRHIIALTLSAVFARGRNANPVWLYVDEFQDFVDEEATPRHFRLAREYKLGIIAAHQNMFCNELTESLRTAISGNTAIKYCAKVSGGDRAYMLRDLGCDEAFLDQQVSDKAQQLVKFACVVRGHPPFSVAIKYPSIAPDMLSDAQAQPLQAVQTHKPPATDGLRADQSPPTEADPPSIPPPDSPPPAKTEDSDSATDW
jgi:hypothetical protein